MARVKQQVQKKKMVKPKQKKAKRTVSLSSCVEKYVYARASPFDPRAIGACNPSPGSGDTFKFSSRVIHTINHNRPTPTDYHYFIGVAPNAANLGISAQSFEMLGNKNLDDAYVTSSETDIKNNFGFDSGGTYFAGFLETRCVGWGVKIVNEGPPLYQQGSVRGITAPSFGVDYATNSDIGGLLTHPQTRYKRAADCVERTPFHLEMQAQDEVVGPTIYYASASAGGQSFVEGTAGTPRVGGTYIELPYDSQGSVNFRVEIVAHWEARGRFVSSYAVPNERDSAWTYAADAFSSISKQAKASLPSADEIVKLTLSGFKDELLRQFTSSRHMLTL